MSNLDVDGDARDSDGLIMVIVLAGGVEVVDVVVLGAAAMVQWLLRL